jgi:dTDP-4-dehydrorhamnose 3,5-epimerase
MILLIPKMQFLHSQLFIYFSILLMKFEELSISGVFKITLNPKADHRGWFARTYCTQEMQANGIHFDITQINHSFTKTKGSFRGIHYQFGAFAEYKLVRCIAGAVLDFGIDLRKNSSTLYQHVAVELSATNHTMLLLPPGIGHAFQTIADDTALIYLHSSFYNAQFEGGVRHNDAKINLHLPLTIADISDRDLNHPLLAENFLGIEYEL